MPLILYSYTKNPIVFKYLSKFTRRRILKFHKSYMSYYQISHHLDILFNSVKDIILKENPEMEEAFRNHSISYFEIAKRVAHNVSDKTEDIGERVRDEEVFLIIDNAKTHLPFRRWLRGQGITLLEISAYSLGLSPVGSIWSLVKYKFHKYYPELYLMKSPVNEVKKAIEETITDYWKLLDPKVFDTLAGSMVDRMEAIIKADGCGEQKYVHIMLGLTKNVNSHLSLSQASMPANMSFLGLPNELILKIANELNPPDLCSLLKANHRLAALLYFALIDSVCRKGSESYATEALHSAAKGRNKEVVRDLLDRGILGNIQNSDALLSHAVEMHSEAVVQTLLERGANAETRDCYGRTPLADAAACGHEEMVRMLIDLGADVNSQDNLKRTPLHTASLSRHEGSEEIVRLLLQDPRVLDVKDVKDGRPCILRPGRNRPRLIDPNSLSGRNWGAIHWAAKMGNEEILKYLLEHKQLDIDPGPPNNLGPLHVAAVQGTIVSVRLLLETGRLNINRTNTLQGTPLHCATAGGHDEIVQLLLAQKDVDIDIADYNGHSVRSSISIYPPKVCEILTEYVSPNRGNATEPASSPE
ncbi:ankyrin repeat-containing domain protein [Tuber brumale]|nr:ankyrin repeat-containing domain protein [Tuber brumale]